MVFSSFDSGRFLGRVFPRFVPWKISRTGPSILTGNSQTFPLVPALVTHGLTRRIRCTLISILGDIKRQTAILCSLFSPVEAPPEVGRNAPASSALFQFRPEAESKRETQCETHAHTEVLKKSWKEADWRRLLPNGTYCNSFNTSCCCWLAWARAEMPVCSRMEYLVRFATAAGMSAAVMVFSAAVRFCT
jgi:hypothetical protein